MRVTLNYLEKAIFWRENAKIFRLVAMGVTFSKNVSHSWVWHVIGWFDGDEHHIRKLTKKDILTNLLIFAKSITFKSKIRKRII